MHRALTTFTPADDDSTGIASTAAGTSGQPFTLDAEGPADGLAHLLTFAPSGSVTGNYEITGTDADGLPQTETLATDTTNTVTSTKYFATVTEVLAPSGIGAETVNIGWTDDTVSPTIPINWRQDSFGAAVAVSISGTIDYTVQHCFESFREVAPSTLDWWPHASLAAKTASADGNYAFPVRGVRFLINSLTAGATIGIRVVQSC